MASLEQPDDLEAPRRLYAILPWIIPYLLATFTVELRSSISQVNTR